MPTPLRHFLQKQPQPDAVRGVLLDGKERLVKIQRASKSKWRDAEQALDGCSRLEALDPSGAVLRMCELEVDDHEAEAAAAASRAEKLGPLAAVVEVARLINEAADKAAARHAAAFAMGFEQQALVIKLMSERLAQLERAWHRLLMSQESPPANGESSMLDGRVAQVVAARLGPQPMGAPPDGNGNGAPNGVG